MPRISTYGSYLSVSYYNSSSNAVMLAVYDSTDSSNSNVVMKGGYNISNVYQNS